MTENKRLDIKREGHYISIISDLTHQVELLEKENIVLKKENKLLRRNRNEKEHYEKLYLQMSYYFDDASSFYDLDHDDFEALKKLAKGELLDD